MKIETPSDRVTAALEYARVAHGAQVRKREKHHAPNTRYRHRGTAHNRVAHSDTMKNCAAAWDKMAPADKAKTTYKAYSATCLKKGSTAGAMRGGMMMAAPPAGATAKCKDGTYSMSKAAKGRCSSHGGVEKVL